MATLQPDERFCEKRNTAYISKWLRKSIRQYDDFDQSLEGLQSFFKDIKVLVDLCVCVCLVFGLFLQFITARVKLKQLSLTAGAG